MRNTADVTQRQDEHLDSYEQWARDRLEPVLLHQLALPALVTEDRQNLMPWSPTATVWSEPRPRSAGHALAPSPRRSEFGQARLPPAVPFKQ